MEDILRQLSTLINKRRRRQHLKQTDIAKRANVSLKTISNIETAIDKHDIGIQKVLRVLDELGIEIELKEIESTAQIDEATHSQVQLEDYPQLKLLTWNRVAEDTLSEAEAFELYEHNWRYIDEANLTDAEQRFIKRLTHQYGQGVMNV